LNPKDIESATELLAQSREKLKAVDTKKLKKRLKEMTDYTKSRIDIDGDIYNTLSQDNGKSYLKEKPKRVALAIWKVPSNTIALIVMSRLLTLKNDDNEQDDNSANSRQDLAKDIGEDIHYHIAWQYLKKRYPDNTKEFFREYRDGNFSNIEELSSAILTDEVVAEIGATMIEFATDVEIVAEYDKPNDDKNFRYLKLTTTFLKETKSKKDRALINSASMVYRPMVIPPRDWQGVYGGGFLEDDSDDTPYNLSRYDLTLIKASNQKDRERLLKKQIPSPILEAINHIQKSSFTINREIFEVIKSYHNDIKFLKDDNRIDFAYYRIMRELISSEIYKESIEKIFTHFKKTKFIKLDRSGQLTQTDKRRIKKALKEIDTLQKDGKSIEEIRLDTNLYYDIAKYKQGFDTIVAIAEQMSQFDRFYFVWQMDFRGRIYPKQTLLNPQAGDLPKSMLLFADKKPLTQRGLEWFFIHGANVYGEVDKRPFDERIEWVKNHHDDIIATAKSPRDALFWKRADEPWKFLAFSFEYARYSENPDNFSTSLPVAIDGSNNGFQHITALLRDPEGAKSVNVLPYYEDDRLVVADFYQEVADELKRRLDREIEQFEIEKDSLIERDNLYYSIKTKKIPVAQYHLEPIIEYLEEFAPQELREQQYYSTHLKERLSKILKDSKLNQEYIKEIENILSSEERKIRKDEDDIEEIKELLLDRLDSLYRKAGRDLKREKIFLDNKGRAYKIEQIEILDIRSLYHRFRDRDLINRSFVKKPVMTEAYGSSTIGKAKKLLEDIESNGLLSDIDENTRFLVALAFAQMTEESIEQISGSLTIYKSWIKKRASAILKQNRPVIWKTPLGLEVEQVEYKTKRINVSINRWDNIVFREYTDEIDKKEHKKGIAPNYIHSLDATHLFMTINSLKAKGIQDIITVHDSFATHPNDIDTLSIALRENFVDLHKRSILRELDEFFVEYYGIKPSKKIPQVAPDRFDFREILESEYFFSHLYHLPLSKYRNIGK